jgi:hypothetical protein
MLTINEQIIPDLSVNINLQTYQAEIDKAFIELAGQMDMTIEAGLRAQILNKLIEWSATPVPKKKFGSWALAARNIYSQGGLAVLGQKRLETIAQDKPKIQMAMDSVNWANCGKTSDNILNGLLAGGFPDLADAKKSAKAMVFRAGSGNELCVLLSQVPKSGVTLFDCSFPQVHTFMIEVNETGKHFLSQGYQGAYYANWWAGTDDGLVLTRNESFPADDLQRVREARSKYGMTVTQPVSADAFGAFIQTLGKALDAGPWGKFVTYWLSLPFCPTSGEQDSVARRGDVPELQVTVYSLVIPASAQPAVTPSGSISAAVIPQTIS